MLSFARPAVMHHKRHHILTVLQCILSFQKQLKYAVFFSFQPVGAAVPAVKVTRQVNFVGFRCPLAVIPALFGPVKAKEQMSVCKIRKRLTCGQKRLLFAAVIFQPQTDILLIGRKIWVKRKNFQLHAQHLLFFYFTCHSCFRQWLKIVLF